MSNSPIVKENRERNSSLRNLVDWLPDILLSFLLAYLGESNNRRGLLPDAVIDLYT